VPAFTPRIPAVVLTAGLFLAALYAVVVLTGRYRDTQASPRAGDHPALSTQGAPWLAPDPSDLRISQFYASTGTLVRGESATVCYGTFNAVRVALHPPVRPLSPARNRCLPVSPENDTTYRLEAWDTIGNSRSEAFTIQVLPAPPRILFLEISKLSIRRGERPNLCNGVTNATRLTLRPLMQPLPIRDKFCAIVAPAITTKYTLEAEGPGGKDQLRFTIKLQ
jgi:hypothetical protein